MGDLPDFTRSINTVAPTLLLDNVSIAAPVMVDVSSYQTVVIMLNPDGSVGPQTAFYQFANGVGLDLDAGILSCEASGEPATWQIPVAAQYLILTGGGGPPANTASVYGVNVRQPKRMLKDWNAARLLAATVANGTATNTSTRTLDIVNDTIMKDVSGYNGATNVTWIIGSMGGATKWSLQLGYLKLNQTRQLVRVFDATAAGTYQFSFGHPFAFTSWWVNNTGVLTGASTHNVNIIPAEAP